MARVTVEDCILNVPNRFELVILAAQRAKQIASGNPLTLDRDNDKDAVVSLREIAEKTVAVDDLREETVQAFGRRYSHDIRDMPKDSGETEITEAFEDAQGQAALPKPNDMSGLSFAEDNVQVED